MHCLYICFILIRDIVHINIKHRTQSSTKSYKRANKNEQKMSSQTNRRLFNAGKRFTLFSDLDTKTQYQFTMNPDTGFFILEFGSDPVEVNKEIIINRFHVIEIRQHGVLVISWIMGKLVDVFVRFSQMKFQA